jgi:hypothetical protein
MDVPLVERPDHDEVWSRIGTMAGNIPARSHRVT